MSWSWMEERVQFTKSCAIGLYNSKRLKNIQKVQDPTQDKLVIQRVV
jgi:hypothetical protein